MNVQYSDTILDLNINNGVGPGWKMEHLLVMSEVSPRGYVP